jgi:hypothetical protein
MPRTNLAFWRGAGQKKYSYIQIKGKTCQNPAAAADYIPMGHELKFLQLN